MLNRPLSFAAQTLISFPPPILNVLDAPWVFPEERSTESQLYLLSLHNFPFFP